MIKLYKGDNLEIMEDLLTEKLKFNIIYLDPPYNTKNKDLIYMDNYGSSLEWGREFTKRLELVKKLAAENSVIFVSIGHEEIASAKIALDDVLGKNSFCSILPRISIKTAKTTNTISRVNDFVLVYKLGNVKFSKDEMHGDAYKLRDKHFDKRGPYLLRRLDYKDFHYSKSLDFVIENDKNKYYASGSKEEHDQRNTSNLQKDWCWLWSEKKVKFAIENDYIVFKDNRVFKKTYLNCLIEKINGDYSLKYGRRGRPFSSLELTKNHYLKSSQSKDTIKSKFTYSKSDRFIEFLFNLPDFENKVVLDPYSGSGVSGIVAYKKNIDCVMIQKPEPLNYPIEGKPRIKNAFNLTKEILKEEKIEVQIYE